MPYGRFEVTQRKVTDLLNSEGKAYLSDVQTRGLLVESASVVVYHLNVMNEPGRASAWEFNNLPVARNLRENGQYVWRAKMGGSSWRPEYVEVGIRAWL